MIDPKRFKKIDESECETGDWLRHWPSDWPEVPNANLIGEFLSKIWAHYGPPNGINHEGFDYCLLDIKTGKVFTAYCTGSGPGFAGYYRKYEHGTGFIVIEEELKKLNDSVKAFEDLLENTVPADCEIEFDTDFGICHAGTQNGIPFNK